MSVYLYPPNSVSVAAPVGGSTLAEQQTQTTHLAAIETSVELLDDALAVPGAAEPARGLLVLGSDGTNAVPLLTDAAGALQFGSIAGAATEAKQDDQITELQEIEADIEVGNLILTEIENDTDAMITELQQIEADVEAGNLILAGIETDTDTIITELQEIEADVEGMSAKLPATLGQKASAASLAAVLSTEQETILSAIETATENTETAVEAVQAAIGAQADAAQTDPSQAASLIAIQKGALDLLADILAASGGAASVAKANNPVRNVHSSVNITTAAYVQLVASLTSNASKLEIFDSSGQTLVLATGAAASEVDQFHIFPGGNGPVTFSIAAGTRVSVKAVSANATTGELNINFYT